MKYSFSKSWKAWPYKTIVLVGLVVACIALIAGIFVSRGSKAPQTQAPKSTAVEAVLLSELTQTVNLTREAVVEPLEVAPLIARAGGRITSLSAQVGDSVTGGIVLGKIDGSFEPNPTRVQIRTASEVLGLFNLIEQQGLISADNAVAIAKQSLSATQNGRDIGVDVQQASLGIASNGVDRAQQSLDAAKDTDVDATIKAAELAVEAAQLARQQAIAQTQLSNQGAADGATSAALALENTQTARARTKFELASQRTQLAGQLAVLQEQLRFQDILAPLNGSINELSVQLGDFVSPNQRIGSVVSSRGAKLSFAVQEGVRNALGIDLTLEVSVDDLNLRGIVAAVGNVPNASGLYEVEVHIPNAPVHILGSNAKVLIPATGQGSETILIPLNAVSVRDSGASIFTVDTTNMVSEIPVAIRSYQGDFVEVLADLSPNAAIIVTGNASLRDGQVVEVK